MAWTRHGDNELTHPAMSRLLSATAPTDNPLAVDHIKWAAAFGVFSLLASVSGAHLTDGYVEIGMISRVAPGWETEVLDILEAAGLAKRVKTADPTKPEDPTQRWMIKLDLSDEEFVHIRAREEVELDRRRARDARDEDMQMTVRVRDGDQCRWCGRTVSWKARRGWRRAQIDSLNSHHDSTPETLVVSCHRCNDLRGKGKEFELRPAPKYPYYTDHTIALVNASAWAKDNGVHLESRQTRLNLESEKAAGTGDGDDVGHPAAGTTRAAAHQEAAQDSGAQGRQSHHTSEAPDHRGNDPMEDAPWWVIADDEATAELVRQVMKNHHQAAGTGDGDDVGHPAAGTTRAAAHQEAAQDSGAQGRQSRHTSEAPADGSSSECNETVKPGSNLDRQGYGPGFVGTGRDGKSTARAMPDPATASPKRKRKRGKRGGKR